MSLWPMKVVNVFYQYNQRTDIHLVAVATRHINSTVYSYSMTID